MPHDVIHIYPDNVRELPLPGLHPRPAFGLSMPDLMICGCKARILAHVFYDYWGDRLACRRCVLRTSPGRRGRFRAVTLDARGLIRGVDHFPAGQAIAVLVRFGARVN